MNVIAYKDVRINLELMAHWAFSEEEWEGEQRFYVRFYSPKCSTSIRLGTHDEMVRFADFLDGVSVNYEFQTEE